MALKDRLFKSKRPDWASDIGPEARTLDVRPMLARGDEPLGAALALAGKVGLGEIFIIETPFDPVPLRRVLSRMGFEDHAEELSGSHWRVHFRRIATGAGDAPSGARSARVWSEAEVWHIDVRGLEPPEPMLAIIALVEAPALEGPVIVHHEREPVYLYPELAERGWRWAHIDGKAGEFRLRLERE